MVLSRKERVIVFRKDSGSLIGLHSTGFTTKSNGTTTVKGNQVTDSEPHAVSLLGRRGIKSDIGGPFRTLKNHYKDERGFPFNPTYNLRENYPPNVSGTWGYSYRGPLYPLIVDANGYPAYPPSAETSDADLIPWGTEAIARCKPTNSLADTAVTLAEIYREGLPSLLGIPLWKDRTNLARGAGSEYLNIQFGWLPLISGIKDVAKAVTKADEVWRQYVRDSGRQVRRSYEFPLETTTTTSTLSGNGLPLAAKGVSLPSVFWSGGSTGQTLIRERVVTKRRWFDGAFVYYVPDKETDKLGYAAAYARKIYGVTLDPEVLWNLTPWSWAADWFVNAGSVISNVTDMATDGLVLRYGYLMEHSIVEDRYRLTHNLHVKHGVPNPLTCTLVTEVKKRVVASPYGFGLTYDGLTDRQKTIIAALGLTKLK